MQWKINGENWKPNPFRANPARDSLELWEIQVRDLKVHSKRRYHPDYI
jgi:hypothetical protein